MFEMLYICLSEFYTAVYLCLIFNMLGASKTESGLVNSSQSLRDPVLFILRDEMFISDLSNCPLFEILLSFKRNVF